MIIPVSGRLDFKALLSKHKAFNQYLIIDYKITKQGYICILLTSKIPERIRGMFTPVVSHSHYIAFVLQVDWVNGDVLDESMIDFGVCKPNIHYIDQFDDGFLLLGARARSGFKNALITDMHGQTVSELYLGDAIQDCMVNNQDEIITSYFDEGVFGDGPGTAGIIRWSKTGEVLWDAAKYEIADCYAMNLDHEDKLWFCYYTDFALVKTDFKSETVYHPDIFGASSFLFQQSQQYILFDNGYRKRSTFSALQWKGYTLQKEKTATQFTWNDQVISPVQNCFRGSKALLVDEDDAIYFTDWV